MMKFRRDVSLRLSSSSEIRTYHVIYVKNIVKRKHDVDIINNNEYFIDCRRKHLIR